MAILVWPMMGVALWHFAVFVPDRLWGGIIGAFLAALIGGIAGGYALPSPGFPGRLDEAPGIASALWAMPGALVALGLTYCATAHRSRR